MKTKLCLMAVLATALSAPTCVVAADDLSTRLQKGLFEEEANRNLDAAIQAYQSVIAQFDKDRQLAATAVFRLAECYRKLGKTNDAVAQYQRVLRDFADQSPLTQLSEQNLFALGAPPSLAVRHGTLSGQRPDARQRGLILEEIALVQRQLNEAKKKVEVGVLPTTGTIRYERELLRLKRELAAIDEPPGGQQQRKLLQEEIRLQELVVQEVKKRLETGRADGGEEIEQQRELLALKRELASMDEAPGEVASANLAATDEEQREVQRIKALIQDSPDLINSPDQPGQTPLHKAAAAGQLVVARFLLANKADVNARLTKDGSATPLILAARSGHKTMVELLLANGADVNASGSLSTGGTKRTGTALHFASANNYKSLAEVLL